MEMHIMPFISMRKNLRMILSLILLFFFVGSIFSQNPLPKRAKKQAIIYPSGMIGVGYVYKKQFVENQEVIFIEMPRDHSLSEYYIYEKEGILYIGNYNNEKRTPLFMLETIVRGIYYTYNDTAYIKGFLYSKKPNKSVYEGVFQISNSKTGTYLTTNPKDAIYSLTSYQYSEKLNVKIVDIDSYIGYSDNNIIELKKLSNEYSMKMDFDDRVLETIISSNNIKKYGFFEFDDLIKSSENVKLNYKNGNDFIGIVEKNDKTYSAKQGVYKFTTGEIYKGSFSSQSLIYRNGRIFVPYEGETIFADGTTASGDWLKQYNFTDDEWEDIYKNSKSLTQIRDNAFMVNAKKLKTLREDKRVKDQAEQENRLRVQQQKQEYISKYGNYFGTLISKGELEIGMSQVMVNEIWNKNFFILSKSARNGKSNEIWEYSKDKMEKEIMMKAYKTNGKEGGEAALATIQLMNLSRQLGGPRVPQMLIFTNNKLTDIYR